ncbi:cytochrome c oxidase subunit 4 [Okibacterium endophyticum]
MKTNAVLFWILAAYFAVLAVVYTLWNIHDPQHSYFSADYFEQGGGPSVEWAGTVALSLAAIMSTFIAFYVGRTRSHQGGELPEDILTANVDDGDPEIGHFSPWSWWPIFLAGAAALLLLGIAVGFWISFFAAPLLVISIVGWTYEYYRGYHVS